ncbi:hypothetical protein H5410_035970 [Solanum commersonii]|uniref:Endonuclease/exonuclease/phosphatase domain-containing protein n=1 Tax=Solanum commersonii TaxID=4109 RepID=A0A9J5Y431_SOLCO|nr:hypothetical protein H5410_035970 [Solanum commersonii]
MYGYNTGDKRKELWTNLRDLAIGMTTSWLICGDFNTLLYPEDRLSSNPVQPTEIADFSNCLHDLSLNELCWKGDTWTNNLLLDFFNVWAEHSSFLSLVEKEWQKRKAIGHMKNIWIHLRSLKQKIAKLNQEEFKAVT